MNATQNIDTLKGNIFKRKKSKNDLPFQKDGQITDFCFASFRFGRKIRRNKQTNKQKTNKQTKNKRTNKRKTQFPKGIFQ